VSTVTSPVQHPERSRDLERFITFIDAIVAIAITLLVLPLVDLAIEIEPGDSVHDLLTTHQAPIGAFLLSFVVIANLWLIQHRMLSNVREGNDALTRLLLLWSLTIVVLPFPTALAAGPYGTGDQTAAKAFYVGTMMLSSFLLSAMALLLTRQPQLRDNEHAPDVWRSCATSITFVVALLVMVLIPATGYWPLLLLVVSDRAGAMAKAAVGRRRKPTTR
jgi:TMEM175 potassium channel family protein